MKKKVLLLTLILLIVVLAAAAVLYPRLSASMQPQQMATTPPVTTGTTQPTTAEATQPATEIPETTAATEPTERVTVKAPNFTAVDWDGNEVQLSDYAGKPIVLNFWTYWCTYCKKEMPEFQEVYEELDGEVTFLMVHADTNTESGKEAVADAGYTFTMLFDEERIAKMTYGVNSYPFTFFIDAQGNLQGYYPGRMGADLLRQCIDLINPME